jgi:hypothetical protein
MHPTIIGTSFQGSVVVPAGGWYTIELRALIGKQWIYSALIEHVGVGEIFVIAGQSNAANFGEVKQQVATGKVSTWNGSGWQLGNDPQPMAEGNAGSFIPPFADAIVNRFKVPVGIIACGIGATSIREWLPDDIFFPAPPTIESRVKKLSNNQWYSNGDAYQRLISLLKSIGPLGLRAVLWHQGESDANQTDTSRTLPGTLYRKFLIEIITRSRKDIGWQVPWVVAQASYHTPGDERSQDIRAAQKSVSDSGIALLGPDTDLLKGELRENNGQGVHFSNVGLKEHAARWVEKITPWLDRQLVDSSFKKKLPIAGEVFSVNGSPAFIILPHKFSETIPWVWYAPTLPGLPSTEEKWMFEAFLNKGIAIAGIDAGESYGSPDGRKIFSALYQELIDRHGFSTKPMMLGRSRGGLQTLSWAAENPGSVSGFAGIYPVAILPAIQAFQRPATPIICQHLNFNRNFRYIIP